MALPVSAPQAALDLVRSHGTEVLLDQAVQPRPDGRPRPGPASASPATLRGGFILPGFLPAFDAAATLVKVLDLLAFQQRRLSEVVAALPQVHLAHELVVTPWEQKGTVMRTLVEQSKDREVELVDGVKVLHDDGLGAGPARSRGARHPRVGRGSHRRRCPAPGPGVRPADPPDGALGTPSSAVCRREPSRVG